MERCPKCGELYEGYPAISRRDNKTKICSRCGAAEAMFDFAVYLSKRENKEDNDNE